MCGLPLNQCFRFSSSRATHFEEALQRFSEACASSATATAAAANNNSIDGQTTALSPPLPSPPTAYPYDIPCLRPLLSHVSALLGELVVSFWVFYMYTCFMRGPSL